MYPFGSGAPYNPNQNPPYPQAGAPFGAGAGPYQPSAVPGYPSQQSTPGYPPIPGYPPQQMPGMPGAGGYGSPAMPGYPPMPGYPSQPMPGAGGYATPPMPGYPSQSMPGYPPAQASPGYPSAQAPSGYPPTQSSSGYPPNQSASGYPTTQTQQSPGYPQAQPSAGYPPSQPSSGYPPTQPSAGYPPTQPSSGYPPTQSSAGYENSQTQTVPSSTNTSSPYPTQKYEVVGARNMANCFNEMKSHVTNIITESKGTPTVRPADPFDSVNDCKMLRKAMKGFGTDEDAIINIICRRSNEQRQVIQRDFKTNFGKDLIDDIKSETSGNFETLLVSLLTPIVTFYCKELHDAIAGIGTKEEVLIEILCTLSNYEINVIKDAYHRQYRRTLEDDLINDLSGNFKRLMISLCCGNRDESGRTDPVAAQREATELLRAGELMVGTDESTFNRVLCKTGFPQLKLICEEYKKICGHTLADAIEKEFSGDIKEGLLTIVGCVENKAKYFASRLHKSMAGFGTTDSQLIRVIVTRAEIDLYDIKVAFEQTYGKSLKSWIKGDTSGHYRHCLYALIGEQRS